MIAPPHGVTSLRGRANVVVVLLIANVGWSLVSIGAVLGELDILERARDGRFVSQAEALASDDRVRTATTIALVLNIVTIVGWLVWQHRGQRNLSRLGVRQLRFTPAWAVGWWFVPIANSGSRSSPCGSCGGRAEPGWTTPPGPASEPGR